MIVASCLTPDVETLKRQASRAFARGAAVVEVRADRLDDPEPGKIRRLVDGPALYTLRSREQGGHFRGDRRARVSLLEGAGKAGFEFVDEEPGDAMTLPDGCHRIRSRHFPRFDRKAIGSAIEEMKRGAPAILKLVSHAQNLAEEIEILAIQKEIGEIGAVFSMGHSALLSRVLGPKFKSPLTFCSAASDAPAAPGQPSIEVLTGLYRVHRILPSTRVFGLAGWPVGHSRSPAYHNRAFQDAGIDGVYVPLGAPDFETIWKARGWLDLHGLSVTIPHKQAALAACDTASDIARAAGCANTLVRTPCGWLADNTDVPAVERAFEDAGVALRGKRALILGAGGAARAVALAVRKAGGAIVVASRNPEKGKALAGDFGGTWVPFERAGEAEADIVVNTTPVGMWPDTEGTPLDPEFFANRSAAFDVIYNPEETLFLRSARDMGLRTIGGMSMFLAQGRLQHKAFVSGGARWSC